MHRERLIEPGSAEIELPLVPAVEESPSDASPVPTSRQSKRSESDLAGIAETLRNARRRKGLTQRELGRVAGVPQSHISKIEAGGVDLRLSSLLALAAVLDLRLELQPAQAAGSVAALLAEPIATLRAPVLAAQRYGAAEGLDDEPPEAVAG